MLKKGKDSIQNLINRLMAKRFGTAGKVIIVILFAGALWFGWKWLNNYTAAIKNQPSIVLTVPPPSPPQAPEKMKKKTKKEKKPEEKKDNSAQPVAAAEVRDPFLPSLDSMKQIPDDRMKPVTDLKVSGILWDQQIPTAIINSKVVKIGDIIDGKTIVDMDKDKVILMDNGRIFILKLRQKSP